EAPMLYIGEELGSGRGPYLDIAVDPVEGTTPMSKGQENSLTVIAGGPRGSLLHAPDMYMRKMAVGPKAKGYIDLNKSLTDNMHSVAKALGKEVKELTVMIQDRPRHEELINEVLNLGARIKLFHDVDIPGAIATAFDRYEIDMLVGIGGAPEGVIAATALKCLGGDFQGQLIPYNEEEKERCKKMGIDHPGKVFALNEIVQSDKCFFVATGITDGLLLNGIKKTSARFESHSIITVGGDNRFFQFIKSNY
ncbi:class II fructose-bisphosphatase, partial [Alkalihalobacillus alcalophilus]